MPRKDPEARRQYRREWYQRNAEAQKARVAPRRDAQVKANREVVLAAKDVPCTDCGVKYPSYVMDFDHVRGIKKFNLSRTMGVKTEVLLEEIAKCEVVCANCHRERTFTSKLKGRAAVS